MTRRLVITGALGHIGSQLIRSLRPGDFDDIALVDNLSTERHGSLAGLPDGVPFRFIEGDVRTEALDAIVQDAAVVVHLAAVTDAAASLDDAERFDGVNVGGTVRVAEACARHGCGLVFLSTTSVYGGSHNPYTVGKRRAEQLLQAMSERHGLRLFIGRCGTICGPSPGMRFHTAISKFCWQASTGQPLSVWRTAMDQARPYLDLDDAVRAIRFVIDRRLFDGSIYDLVTASATVREVIDLLREVAPDITIALVDSPLMDRQSFAISPERFCAHGFTFRGDLRSGIRRTLAHLDGVRRLGMLHQLP